MRNPSRNINTYWYQVGMDHFVLTLLVSLSKSKNPT